MFVLLYASYIYSFAYSGLVSVSFVSLFFRTSFKTRLTVILVRM